MKKIIAMLMLILMLFTTACSTATQEEKDAMIKYEECIKKLENITLDSEYDILSAEAAYNALSADQKASVSNEVVVNARSTFDIMKKLSEILPGLCTKLEYIFIPNQSARFEDFKEDYDYVVENVGKLSEEQKAQVGNTDKFLELKEKYEAEADNVFAVAKLYAAAFLEINENAEITEIACIVNVLNGKTNYYPALKYDDGNGEKTVYSNVVMETGHPKESLVHFASSFYADKPSGENMDAFRNGNYPVDTASVLEAIGK